MKMDDDSVKHNTKPYGPMGLLSPTTTKSRRLYIFMLIAPEVLQFTAFGILTPRKTNLIIIKSKLVGFDYKFLGILLTR